MPRKKKVSKPAAAKEKPPQPETAAAAPAAGAPVGKMPASAMPPEEPAAVPAPPAPARPARQNGGNSAIKTTAVIILFFAALLVAYYILAMPGNTFVTGQEVDAETFKNIFLDAQNVYIVMDIRGASDDIVSNNILQCGVDFAGSTGMGGKAVTPLSISNDGCVYPEGFLTTEDCFSMVKDGTTVYVREGAGGAKYYSNGMVVYVGSDYALGTCSIKRA
jgi:hypothetical protein